MAQGNKYTVSTDKRKKEVAESQSLPVNVYKVPSYNSEAIEKLASLQAGYDATKDAAVVNAKAKLDALQKPSQSAQLTAIRDKVLNRSPFQYNMNEDSLYQQYKDNYTRQGRIAMQDAMGQAASLTGGYGNSYAATAGQQTYNGYMQQLNDMVPQLYQLAYERYQNEQNADRQDWASLYGEYRDQMGDYYNDYGLLSDEYWNQYNAGHTRWNDQYNAAIDERDFQYNSAIDERNFQYQKERDAYADSIDERNFQYQKEQDAYARQQDRINNYLSMGDYDSLDALGYNTANLRASANSDGSESGVGLFTFSRIEGNNAYFYDSEGNERKVAKGQNPYNGSINSDIQYGAFSNGYQPNNIGGRDLHRAKDEDGQNIKENINGRQQQVWYTEDAAGNKTYYLWDGTKNEYRIAEYYE